MLHKCSSKIFHPRETLHHIETMFVYGGHYMVSEEDLKFENMHFICRFLLFFNYLFLYMKMKIIIIIFFNSVSILLINETLKSTCEQCTCVHAMYFTWSLFGHIFNFEFIVVNMLRLNWASHFFLAKNCQMPTLPQVFNENSPCSKK